MRALIHWLQTNQGCLTTTLLITLYYTAIYRPLNNKTQQLDTPLQHTWQQITQHNQTNQNPTNQQLTQIKQTLQQHNTDKTADPTQTTLNHIQLDPQTQTRIQTPFQLINYQNQRQTTIETLQHQANQNNTHIQPQTLQNLPQHNSTDPNPHYLWAELNLTQHLLQAAIHAQIQTIQTLTTQRQPTNPQTNQPIPLNLQLTLQANAHQLTQLLLLLPRRTPQIHTHLNPNYPPHKPPLYTHQILIQKTNPQQPTQINATLKITAYIPPTTNPTNPQPN